MHYFKLKIGNNRLSTCYMTLNLIFISATFQARVPTLTSLQCCFKGQCENLLNDGCTGNNASS
jgi:hypothetical protein